VRHHRTARPRHREIQLKFALIQRKRCSVSITGRGWWFHDVVFGAAVVAAEIPSPTRSGGANDAAGCRS